MQRLDTWTVRKGSVHRIALNADASASIILDVVAEAAQSVGSDHNARWGVAIPGPFDYVHGVGRYEHVGKFETLNGTDVGAGLAKRLGIDTAQITFLNDADAFGIGEHALSYPASTRLVCITLGTGIGSAFLADGIPQKSGVGVPPDGSCHLLNYRGEALEEAVSRRAIRRQYAAATAPDQPREAEGQLDVHEIAALGRQGDDLAFRVLDTAFTALGEVIAPCLLDFEAEALIIGGSMAGSWGIVYPAVLKGLIAGRPQLRLLAITQSDRFEGACLIGAARWAQRSATAS